MLWLSLAVQGCGSCCFLCSPVIKSSVTITLDDQPITLQFANLGVHEDAKPFRELLEKLEAGKPVDVNKPDELGETPIEMAVEYALGNRYSYQGCRDENFYAVRYLLVHGADINLKHSFKNSESTALHRLCASLRGKGEVGIRGLALFLSHGAKPDIENTNHKTPLDYLEEDEPWVSEELRERYEEQDKGDQPKSKPLHDEDRPPPAWKAHISLAERGRLKQVYLTRVAQGLLKTKQHKPLNTAFADYVAQAGVEMSLVQQLRSRTS